MVFSHIFKGLVCGHDFTRIFLKLFMISNSMTHQSKINYEYFNHRWQQRTSYKRFDFQELVSDSGMLKFREVDINFSNIWRVFISGSSSAGKTYFARQLLENSFIKCDRVYYFHPDIQETFPVDWEDHLTIPICFQAGIPTEKDLLAMPHNSCIILDDLYTQACADRTIDYLFRVLSSKRKLHVIIMTQRYFAEGSNGLNIRNSCNYHVLMNNADERTNSRVANIMSARDSIKKAMEINSQKLYPYIFLDKTNQARVTGVQVYTDLFGKFQQVVVNSMVSYLISESDFKAHFNSIDSHTAVKNENKKQRNIKRDGSAASENQKNQESDTSTSSSLTTGSHTDEPDEYTFKQRRQLDFKIKQALRRYKIRSKL